MGAAVKLYHAVGLAIMLWLCAALLGVATGARGHDGYTDWKRPDGGGSCCNNIDCRPVEWEFRRGEDGRSVLWIAPGGVWMPADPAAMLSLPSNDGTAHACFMWVNGRPKPHCIQQPGGAS